MPNTFVLIDYSEHYFTTIAKNGVPAERSGKFIQIANEETEYLVLSPRELSKYHANIVERFCAENEVEGQFIQVNDYFDVLDPNWEVVGGGTWSVDEKRKILSLSGRSQAYGSFNFRDLKEKMLQLPEMEGYTLYINGR